jgi:hypothetical protein
VRLGRLVLVLVVGIEAAACSPSQASGAKTPASVEPSGKYPFAERVAARFREHDPSCGVVVTGPNDLELKNPGDRRLFLANLRSECELSPESCDAKIERLVRLTLEGPPEPALTRETLLPILKNAVWTKNAQGALRDGRKLAIFPFVGGLQIVLVEDTPEMTRPIVESELSALGLSDEAALQLARRNLLRLSTGFRLKEMAHGLFGLVANDGYDATRFILHAEWEQLSHEVEGALIVAPIGRDLVFFTGTESEGLEALRLILEAEREQPAAPYPVTTQAFRWTEAGWAPFDL